MNKLKLEFDEALELCEQVRALNKKKTISFNKMWCWGCAKFTSAPEKRCFANAEDGSNTGCTQVNKLYKKYKHIET
ncbi:MAG: hypothetical protein ACFFAB_17485 [Candidatus Heimdallarchaeota archaeon]